jgi:hypothetical protein
MSRTPALLVFTNSPINERELAVVGMKQSPAEKLTIECSIMTPYSTKISWGQQWMKGEQKRWKIGLGVERGPELVHHCFAWVNIIPHWDAFTTNVTFANTCVNAKCIHQIIADVLQYDLILMIHHYIITVSICSIKTHFNHVFNFTFFNSNIISTFFFINTKIQLNNKYSFIYTIRFSVCYI